MVRSTRDLKIGNNKAPQGVSHNATKSIDGLLYVALAIGYLEMAGLVYRCATTRLVLLHMYASSTFIGKSHRYVVSRITTQYRINERDPLRDPRIPASIFSSPQSAHCLPSA
ncbi:hypothetical protein BDV24DRAFT_130726 [Aspergillus arachidicola]|uniref:Uncharacterized protein n=1 Tax=Aspergillus arachidicola TaxID=656916 RepID=A0A5N6YA31_9EURO|nr:hypothetical protein BDV24DRAFT_130726 [Aspergillus arachidicola]